MRKQAEIRLIQTYLKKLEELAQSAENKEMYRQKYRRGLDRIRELENGAVPRITSEKVFILTGSPIYARELVDTMGLNNTTFKGHDDDTLTSNRRNSQSTRNLDQSS